eukprot:7315879-Pyramimonas_sp.AAC.2
MFIRVRGTSSRAGGGIDECTVTVGAVVVGNLVVGATIVTVGAAVVGEVVGALLICVGAVVGAVVVGAEVVGEFVGKVLPDVLHKSNRCGTNTENIHCSDDSLNRSRLCRRRHIEHCMSSLSPSQ